MRKNRERGQLDVFKLGRMFIEEESKGLKQIEIARKYGYTITSCPKGDKSTSVSEIIDIAKHEKEIRAYLNSDASEFISYYKASKVLRELKRKQS